MIFRAQFIYGKAMTVLKADELFKKNNHRYLYKDIQSKQPQS